MPRTAIPLTILLLSVFIFIPSNILAESPIILQRQEITITLSDQGLFIEEELIYLQASINTTLLTISVPSSASQIELTPTGSTDPFLIYPSNGNTYEFNLSEKNLSLQTSDINLHLSYMLSTNIENFQKTILYDTEFITITFNDRTIFQAENLIFSDAEKNSLNLALYRPTEAPLSFTALIIIFSLLVVLIVVMLLLVRKKRQPTTSTETETSDLLNTKKSLYLSILKDIEKQYRNKELSDENYTKLKAEFKQKAVQVMRKIEESK